MDRRAWQATVHGISESNITERLTRNKTIYFYSLKHTFNKKAMTIIAFIIKIKYDRKN